MQTVETIYLHWTATGYNWKNPGHYHTVIQGDGTVSRLTPYDQFLPAHTYRRNTNAVGIAIACMGGDTTNDSWADYPPTEQQIEAMCKETARLAKEDLKWKKADITIQKVMTHAEAASCLDGRYLHDNYGPVPWGGTGHRWDLMQLQKRGKDDGGDILREKIREYMDVLPSPLPDPVVREVQIDCNGTNITGSLYSNKSTYAPISDLAKAYNLGIDWNPTNKKVILFGEDMPLPKYAQDDLGLQGVPIADVCSRNDRVIMTGFIKNAHVYVRVVEFANEFDIPLKVVDGVIKLGPLKNYGG